MATVPVKDVLRIVRQNYQEADRQVQEKAKKMKATCKRGCSACCYQLISVSFIEALTVADYLLRNRTSDELKQIKVRLKEQSDRLEKEPSRRTIFEERKPCTFLKVGDTPFSGDCTVYGSRPVACRLHYVVSDPFLCSPDAPDVKIQMLDVTQFHIHILKIITGGSPELASHGPLEPMVLHALEIAETETGPSPLVLEHWRRRTSAMLSHSRAVMEANDIKETYVKDE